MTQFIQYDALIAKWMTHMKSVYHNGHIEAQ